MQYSIQVLVTTPTKLSLINAHFKFLGGHYIEF